MPTIKGLQDASQNYENARRLADGYLATRNDLIRELAPGHTQQELAEAAGINRQRVAQITGGAARASA